MMLKMLRCCASAAAAADDDDHSSNVINYYAKIRGITKTYSLHPCHPSVQFNSTTTHSGPIISFNSAPDQHGLHTNKVSQKNYCLSALYPFSHQRATRTSERAQSWSDLILFRTYFHTFPTIRRPYAKSLIIVVKLLNDHSFILSFTPG